MTAANGGLEAVEFLFPYAFDVGDILRRLSDHGLKLVLYNLPAGDRTPMATDRRPKWPHQIIVALKFEALAEALIRTANAGADPARVRQALMGGVASSKLSEVHVKRRFDPGFRIELHQNELNRALRVRAVSPCRCRPWRLPRSSSIRASPALERLANFEIGQRAD